MGHVIIKYVLSMLFWEKRNFLNKINYWYCPVLKCTICNGQGVGRLKAVHCTSSFFVCYGRNLEKSRGHPV